MNPAAEGKSESIRHLGTQTAIVMAGTAFTFFLGLPFQVYLARSLGTAGLGSVGIAESITLTVAGFLSFGLAPLAIRYIPEYRVKGSSSAIRRLVVLGLVLLCASGVAGALLIAPLVTRLQVTFDITSETIGVFRVLAWLLPVSMVSFFIANSLRGFQEIRIVVFSTSFLALTAKVALTLVLFTVYGVSPLVYAWAIVLAQGLSILPMAWKLRGLIVTMPPERTPEQVDSRAWASYAGTNYSMGLLGALSGNLDRLVIGALLGPSAVGVLMVARQLKQFPAVFQHVVLTVISPVFAKLKADGDTAGLAHQLHLANDWIMRLAAGLILMLAFLADQLLALYGPEFTANGTLLLQIMTVSVAIHIAGGPVGILLNMTGHHLPLLWLSLLTAVTVIASYFVMIPIFGLVGAGLAVLLSDIINKGVTIWLVRQRLGISWYDPRFRSWVLPALATGAVLFTLRPIISSSDGLGSLAALLVGAAILAYAVFFSVNLATGLHEDDRELIQAARGRIARLRKTGADPR